MKNRKKHFYRIWLNFFHLTEKEVEIKLQRLVESGIEEILAGGDIGATLRGARLASRYGLKVMHWHMLMINNQEKLLKDHRDWYTVNRLGISSADSPAYVKYYRWLCPNNEMVGDYLQKVVTEYCQIEELNGLHLDYVRYSDVILPVKCQKQYGLVQNREEAEYDYCYCQNCQQKFKSEYGYGIMEVQHPEADANWRQFRLDSISRLVRRLKNKCHQYGKEISAAVFPTPGIARKLVRQNWPEWELDRYYPMLYHEFYEENINWLTSAIAACRQETCQPLSAGLYLPGYKAPELETALNTVKKAGVDGVCFFDEGSLKPRHIEIIKN